MSQPGEMAAALNIKPEKVIAEYYLDRRERSRVLEKHRKDMEKILAKRKEIEEKRKLDKVGTEEEEEAEGPKLEDEIEHLSDKTYLENDLHAIMDDSIRDEIEIEDIYPDLEEDEEETEFSFWLKSISQCLSGKISKEPVRPASPESDEEEEEMEEDIRCMKVVKSVFDEDTASMLVKNYIKYLKVRFYFDSECIMKIRQSRIHPVPSLN